MGIVKNTRKRVTKLLRRIHRYYRYKVYFPRIYNKYCEQPVKKNKIVFLEMRFDTLSSSMSHMYDVMERSGKYELSCSYVHFNFSRGQEFTENVRHFLEELATAECVILDEASIILSCLSLRKETKAINLWHGCGAFKKFGRSTADLRFGASASTLDKYPNYRNLSLVTVSSPEVIWAYEEAMNLPKGIVQATGISRTDLFYDEDFVNSRKEKLFAAMPEARGKKVILYAPTFRGHVASASAPDEIDFAMFEQALGSEYVLVCKHHPFVKNLPEIPEEQSHFARDLTDALTIEDLICTADICISDYSSLIFEYSLFEKPMIFFAYDYEDYCDWRGFYYDYYDLTPGPVVSTQEELLDTLLHIEERFDKKKVEDFREKFMGSCDGHATERIISMI